MIHRFGPFELDDQLFELRQEGRLVAIQRKAFDILCCLIQSPVVVSRADLMAKVWPGVVVTSDSLAQAIMAARAAIGDDGDKPTFIHTVRGRGYRFVAPVETLATAEPSALVGRATSLATLRELLERARTGRGSIALVTGETGIGKTHLVEELCEVAEGTTTVIVRCYEGEGAPDLWPFAQALRELHASGHLQTGDLAALAEGRLSASTLADPQTRFALLEAAARALTEGEEGKPLLLVVDDLQLADPHCLRLLALISARVRTAPLLFVGAYSPTTPRLPSFRAAMGALAQEPSTKVLRLEPFDRDEVAAFVKQATGRAVSDAIATQAFEKTKGNPLLLSQLVNVLGKEERLDQTQLATSALVGGDDMRDAITSMLAALPDAVGSVLTVAAIFGQTFPIAALAAARNESNESVLLALDAAEAARVIARAGAASYRFTYPLVRDVLYKRLTTSARAKLHGSVAGALAAQLGDSEEHSRVAEIADHLVEAAAVGDVDAAVDCSFRAADLAKKAGDHAAAASYARRGLEAFRYAQRPDGARRARLTTFLAALP